MSKRLVLRDRTDTLRLMRLHPEGPPNMTKGGSLVLVVVCLGLGLAGLAAAAEAYEEPGPIRWLFLLPAALASIGSYKTHELFNLWSAGQGEAAKRMQDSASSWCCAALFAAFFAVLGLIDALRAAG